MKPICFPRATTRFALPTLLLLAALPGCQPKQSAATQTANPVPGATTNSTRPTAAPPAGPPAMAPLPPEGVRGIYLTGWSAGLSKRLASLAALVDRTELNAMVIDVKDDGELYYDMDIPMAKEAKALNHAYKVDKVMAVLNEHHIFPIARIACMRDNKLALAHPELAVHDANGNLWHDRSKHYWLNPYKKEVWDYNVAVALDALKHGFKDIQFDYVRFPSEGKVNSLRYDGRPEGAKREDQIAAFLKYAAQKIHAQGGWFSADVFGLTSRVKDDEGIGQKFEKVVQDVDYLCPMVYPSHYAYHEYGMPDPNKEPYKTLTLSVGDAQKRLVANPKCKLRPWIQDFNLRGVHYGPAEVRAEIKALEDLNVHDFLIWNAGNRYTEAALKKGADNTPHTQTTPVPKAASTDTPTAVSGAGGAGGTGKTSATSTAPTSSAKP
jgi:hypothetical protein